MSYQNFYVDGPDDIQKKMGEEYSLGYPVNSQRWVEGSIDKRFKVGDQNLLSVVYGDSSFYNRKRFYFNLIRRHINMVAGYQRQHRKSSTLVPVEDKDQKLANDFTDLSMWSERREGFHESLSCAFEGALDVGDSLLHLYPDYTLDPVSGDLFCDSVSYNSYMIDPWYKKQNLTDCNYVWRRRWVSKEVAKRFSSLSINNNRCFSII